MKKLFKRLLSYNLMFLIVLLAIAKPLNVNAIGGFFTTDSFTFDGSWTDGNNVSHTAYTMQDDNNLPSGYRYYMKVSDGVAICCDAGEVIPNILNYKIGVSMSVQTLANFITSYTQDTSLLGREPTFYDQHPPVLKNGELVGIALNSITGCKMAYATNDDPVTIPSDVTNDVYNYFINVYMVNNPVIDYIVVQTFDGSSPSWGYDGLAATQTAENLLNSQSIICALGYKTNTQTNAYYYRGTSYNNFNRINYQNDVVVTETEGTFNALVNVFQLTAENNYISSLDQIYNTSGYYTWCNLYNKSNFLKRTDINTEYIDTSSGEIWLRNDTTDKVLVMGRSGNSINIPTSSHDTFTIYKNVSVPQSITNNTYSPSYYTSSNTTNYSTSNDNSYTSNVQNINNSTSNNQNIYNETKTTTNNNITENDYNYDYSQQIITNTTIINNYYGDNGSPDNGGGDDNGGGGDDDDDDDDSIWKALLKAIGDFLKKIGELIATVLTGIISILTSVLDAIANITTSFSTITDFLGAVFGFLPSELVAVITLGVTLGILISLIKMFGK